MPPMLDREVVREASVVPAVRGVERRHGSPSERSAEFRDATPLGGHGLDHGNAQARRQAGRVDDDAVRPRLVGHVDRE
jgi:hypothetical protein